ncbi:MAG: hypothetical protein AAFY21_18765 [Cyanobacteria bacterium J06641_2]
MSTDDNKPIELEVQAPQALQTQITPYRRKWGEENKQRVMDLLTFKGRDLEDIAFSAVVYVAGPMFCSSLLFQNFPEFTHLKTINPFTTAIFLISGVVTVIVGITAWWLMQVIPESTPLVIGRLFLILLGVALGASL